MSMCTKQILKSSFTFIQFLKREPIRAFHYVIKCNKYNAGIALLLWISHFIWMLYNRF